MANDTGRKNNEQNKLRTYRKLKEHHAQEPYLTAVKNPSIRASVAKFRLSSHKLMIEKGQHLRLKLEEQICPNVT